MRSSSSNNGNRQASTTTATVPTIQNNEGYWCIKQRRLSTFLIIVSFWMIGQIISPYQTIIEEASTRTSKEDSLIASMNLPQQQATTKEPQQQKRILR